MLHSLPCLYATEQKYCGFGVSPLFFESIMLSVTQDLLTNQRNRPYLRDKVNYAIRHLKGIVAHWTANTSPGAHAKANRNYFNNTDRYASAHYIVDDHSILQCIPDHEVAYHVGAQSYKPDGQRIMDDASFSPNYYLIGFEMCVNADGDWTQTYKNSVALAAALLRRYQFSTNDLYRHFDITGKDCPKMMIESAAWSAFKDDIQKAMIEAGDLPVAKGLVTSNALNVRSGPGITFQVNGLLRENDLVYVLDQSGSWLKIGEARWVSANHVVLKERAAVGSVVDRTGANVRKGPGNQFVVVSTRPNGALVRLISKDGPWWEIEPDHWMHQSLVEPVVWQDGLVIGTAALNVRVGPGTQHRIVRRLHRGDRVSVRETYDRWMRISNSEWVYASFIDLTP